MTSLEGRIDIKVSRLAGRVARVDIASSRPQWADRLLAGRIPAEVVQRVGLFYTICGRAQRIAAEAAIEAAEGRSPDAGMVTQRARAIRAEMAQEHVWRLLVDWPQRSGELADLDALRQVRTAAAGDAQGLPDLLDRLLAEQVLGCPAEAWLAATGLAEFRNWCQAAPTVPARLFARLGRGPDAGVSALPLLPDADRISPEAARALARSALADAAFGARPLWHGRPAETGALARVADLRLPAAWIAEHGRGAGARLLARLVELARLPTLIREGGPAVVSARSLEPGSGLAWVETARGVLLHAVKLEEGRVVAYRIVAPTEWNFHPAGPLAESLRALPGADAADIRLTAQSLDPCVDYGIEVADA